MRLIDADTLNFEGQKYSKMQLLGILNFVEKQPTAYDVEKVVELLENWTCEANIVMPFDNKVLKGRKVIASENAIGIVKEGGRE